MFNPYPFYGYPPPALPMPNDTALLEKGMKIAMRLQEREQREKERQENRKKKDKEEMKKEAAARRARTLTSLEWFIIGALMYPVIGPMYNIAINHLNTMVK